MGWEEMGEWFKIQSHPVFSFIRSVDTCTDTCLYLSHLPGEATVSGRLIKRLVQVTHEY